LPDIIHAHYLFNIPLAAWIGRKYNIPFIATEHWSVFNKPTIPKNVLRMARNNYSYLSALISVSVSLQKSLKEVTKHNSIVISNMVDIAYYNYIERERKSYFQYVSIGSLTKRKCFDLLIRAFSQSHFQQDTRLVIVGEGPEYDHLVRLVSTLNLDKQVHLIGKKNRDSIRSILAKSDAFVLPSAFETFGVVYIEALSTGLPVIATQCGGPEDFINSTNGLLIPINDIDALSTALSIMQDTVSNYNPQLISKTTINQFSPIVIAKQIEHIYKKVCNNDLI
jgi:glycosyltransferase involved in cell wall biosynthesis